jgi:hypothetical protein
MDAQSLATRIRTFFRELFGSRYVTFLESEIGWYRGQLEQARLENSRLQLFLNEVNPAGMLKRRLENPPKPLPASATGTNAARRWAQIEQERFVEIAENKRKEAEASAKKDIANT